MIVVQVGATDNLDDLFSRVDSACLLTLYVDMPEYVRHEMFESLLKHMASPAFYYANHGKRNELTRNIDNIKLHNVGNWTVAYVDTTPPNKSIFDSPKKPYNQARYLDDEYGADLSSWINDGVVPDIAEMMSHRYEIMTGQLTGLDFANQTYYKAGYLDDAQKEIDSKLNDLVMESLKKQGYNVVRLK